jgi:hypothetical protein
MKKLFIIFIAFGLIFAGCSHDGEYSVTYLSFDRTSGYPPADNNKYKYDQEAVVHDQHTLLKTGYTFMNWNTKENGTGDSYVPGSKIKINGAVFLYAMWVIPVE